MKSQLQLNEIEKSHFKAIAINNSEILVIPSSSSAPIDNSQNRINARLVIYREALEECLKAIIKNIKIFRLDLVFHGQNFSEVSVEMLN